MPYRVKPSGREFTDFDEAVEYLIEIKGSGIVEFGTPRGDIIEIYAYPTCRQIANGWGVFLDPFDQQAFVIAGSEGEAWERAAWMLQNLEDV